MLTDGGNWFDLQIRLHFRIRSCDHSGRIRTAIVEGKLGVICSAMRIWDVIVDENFVYRVRICSPWSRRIMVHRLHRRRRRQHESVQRLQMSFFSVVQTLHVRPNVRLHIWISESNTMLCLCSLRSISNVIRVQLSNHGPMDPADLPQK